MTEMKKLGKYSGTVYDFYDKNIPECCSTIEAKLADKTVVITAGVAVSGGVGGTVSADGDRNGDGMERRPGPC